MGKSKPGTNIFLIIFKSLMIYIKNFSALSRVMLFPVFGQVVGMIMIFYPTYLYRENYLIKLSAQNLQQNLVFILLGSLLIVIPGFAVFMKAFWDYMIVTVSLNLMVFDISKKANFGNFKAYNNSVKLRTGDYVILLFIIMFLWLLILIFPFSAFFSGNFINQTFIVALFLLMVLISIIFAVILSVNLSLAFQVFAFETVSPFKVIKRSFTLMKNNFWRTFLMGLILLIVTGVLIPMPVTAFIEKSDLMYNVTAPFEYYVNILAQNQQFTDVLARYSLTPFGLSEILALSTVGGIVTAMILPWGSAAFTLLYYDILPRSAKLKLPEGYEKRINK